MLVTGIHLHQDIVTSIVKHLTADRYFGKVYRKLLSNLQNPSADGPVTIFEQFRLDQGTHFFTWYLRDHALERDRLCIPFHLRQKPFPSRT
jgi:hypothetical protein